MAIVQVKDLIEAGVHFGHRASRWNPKMRPYIYGKRNLIHIIDLRETVRGLLRAYRYLSPGRLPSGGLVLFVGTKRQAKELVEREARRAGMPYVTERWLGGTLTNYRTIRNRLKRLEELEAMWLPARREPEPGRHDPVHEGDADRVRQARPPQGPGDGRHPHALQEDGVDAVNRELAKIRRNLQGIREMNRLPDALVVVDPKKEHIAVKEAQRMGVATVALIDTDSDPDTVDLPIPGNDDSIRSIELILAKLADAVLEGKAALGPGNEERARPRAPQPAPQATHGPDPDLNPIHRTAV